MSKKNIARGKTCHGEYLWSPFTGEEYSACSGDYWNSAKTHVFKDAEGHNMWLMQKSYDRLKGDNIIMKTVNVGNLKDIV